MPIYEYRCTSCGFQKEFLQKVSDPLLTVCTACGKDSFQKMLTAAGFQLKGSGWYATDFRNNGTKPAEKSGGKDDAVTADAPKTESGSDKKPAAEARPSESKPAAAASNASAGAA